MTIRIRRSKRPVLPALLAGASLLLFAPFATLCVAGGHAGIELLFLACCGAEGEAGGGCADGCSDTPADFGASLGAKFPAPIVPLLAADPLAAGLRFLGPAPAARSGFAGRPQQHAALASVLLLS